jgi:hypothetical protein
MSTPDAKAWAEALTMYEQRYSYVLVGPRLHQNWVLDVATVMRREATDPRSWRWIDVDEGEEERLEDPVFPFVLPPAGGKEAEAWRAKLRMVPRASMQRLLVMLSTTWLNIPDEIAHNDFENRRMQLERKARVVLSRFPPEATFFTNVALQDKGDRSRASEPDFYETIAGCAPISQYDWDLGVIAVSRTEVGLFWSFDAT